MRDSAADEARTLRASHVSPSRVSGGDPLRVDPLDNREVGGRPQLGDVADLVADEMRRADQQTTAGRSRWSRWIQRLRRRAAYQTHRSRARLLDWRRRMHSTKAGRIGVKLAVALLGTLVVAVGVLLLPLPGPGWVIILAGLAILAVEFHWARRLLVFTREQLKRWTNMVRQGSWIVRVVSVLGLALVVGAALLLSFTLLR